MIQILIIVAIFFTSITTSYSQFDEIEMDDSQIIEEDPQYKLSPQEQAYLDKIDQYVDYFFDFTENYEGKYQHIYNKINYDADKYLSLKSKLYVIDEYTNSEYATSIRNMITEEKLAATSKEIILVVEYEKGKIKSYNKGVSPDSLRKI